MTSQRNVLYAYSWSLPSSDLAAVQVIMDSIRGFCLELACEDVSDLVVKPDFVGFTAVVPNSGRHEFSLKFSPEKNSWSASSSLRVHSFRQISEIMHHAASLGIVVGTTFAGMILEYRKNTSGVIEVNQRTAFDLDYF